MSEGLVSILVVDDDQVARDLLAEVLRREGYRVHAADGGIAALEDAQRTPVDLALLDIRMPDLDGVEVLRRLKQIRPELDVIMLTAFGTIETAIEALKAGAYDYLSKPFRMEEIKLAIRRALEQRRLLAENRALRRELQERYTLENIVGRSQQMVAVYKTVARVAPTDATVLIEGETGTGKELIARAIHYNSRRAARPFLAIDCTALPEPLFESELFGHERGAFTGAHLTKKGLLEEASGGTIFLDEVGELGLPLQAKLLRVLQEQALRRVGGSEPLKVDVRVIAATNRDLASRVEAGTFREDLYYRLNVIHIRIPPLRDRRDDIPLLARHFLHHYAEQQQKELPVLADEALALLVEYPWPGNVRELQHVIERLLTLSADRVISPGTLAGLLRARVPSSAPEPASAEPLDPLSELVPLEELKRRYILRVLEATGGNKLQAASVLGIHRRTLYRLLDRYGVKVEDEPE